MITLVKGMKVPDDSKLAVVAESGDYAEADLILCAPEGTDFATAMLQAQYVKYGPVVYQFETPEELGKALYEQDPESTHDAVALYKEELARDAARASGTLTPSDPAPIEDAPVPVNNDQEADTQFFRDQAAEEAASSTATTTPEVPVDTGGQVLGESTSTPALPEVIEPAPIVPEATTTPIDTGSMSTTTPTVPEPVPATDLSTTTPE